MVQSALGVGGYGQASGRQRSNDFLRPLGAAAGGVLDGVEGRIKAAEVVDGRQLAGRADGGQLRLPVGTDHQHRLGPLQGRGQLGQRRPGNTGLQGKHRRAMGQEQHRGRSGHAAP